MRPHYPSGGGITITPFRASRPTPFDGASHRHRLPRQCDRAVPRDGGADGRPRARSRRPPCRPHGDRRARFPDAGAGARRGPARPGRRRNLLYVGAGHPRAAPGDRAPLRRALRRRDRARARDRDRRLVCRAAAGDGAHRRPRRSHPALRPRVSVQPAFRPRARRRARRRPGGAGDQLPALGGADRAPLDAAHPRRADRVAVEPDRNDGGAGGDGRDRRRRRPARAAGSSSTRSISA